MWAGAGDIGQCSADGQHSQLSFIQFRHAPAKIGDGDKTASLTLGHNVFCSSLLKRAHITQADPQGDVFVRFCFYFFQRAMPVGVGNGDGQELQAMAAGVLHQGCGAVKTHGLVVEQGGGVSAKIMDFQIGRGIGDEGEAGGVRFGKAVERK